jgi:protoporphyrinogen oxidase
MVGRIPKPPKEDIIASTKGDSREGYTHQLHFYYPSFGGFQSLVDKYSEVAQIDGSVYTDQRIQKIINKSGSWHIETQNKSYDFENVINCMPLHELRNVLTVPEDVNQAINNLKYNSIHIIALTVSVDNIGDHFAVYVPNSDIIFHRFSKLPFLGDSYTGNDGEITIIAEVTFRPESNLSRMPETVILEEVISGFEKLGMFNKNDVLETTIKTEKYAYVIYDLDHRKNTDYVLNYLESIGIKSVGRFAQFEYLNTDGVVENTLALAREINGRTDIDFSNLLTDT